MRQISRRSGLLLQALTSTVMSAPTPNQTLVDLIDSQWYAPAAYWNTDLTKTLSGAGTHGFVFLSNQSAAGDRGPGQGVGLGDVYNYCTMAHVSKDTYRAPRKHFKLEFVEVIHRHHRRTPYSANLVSTIVEVVY